MKPPPHFLLTIILYLTSLYMVVVVAEWLLRTH